MMCVQESLSTCPMENKYKVYKTQFQVVIWYSVRAITPFTAKICCFVIRRTVQEHCTHRFNSNTNQTKTIRHTKKCKEPWTPFLYI